LLEKTSLHSFAFLLVALTLGVLAAQPADAQRGEFRGLGSKCLDVLEGGADPGTPLILFECGPQPNQTFNVEQIGSQIRIHAAGDLCVQPDPGGTIEPLDAVVLGDCSGSPSLWNISGWFPEYFSLRHVDTGLCMDVLGSSTANKTPIVVFDCTGNENQSWWFRSRVIGGPPVGQAGDLQGIGDNCFDVTGSNTADGTPMILFRCTGGANQEWTFESVGGALRLRGLADKCAIPGGPQTGDFEQLVLGDCADVGALWNVTEVGEAPNFGLVNAQTGDCLDVLGSGTDDFTPAGLFRCTGRANQAWRFEPRSVAGRCIPSSNRLCLNGNRFQVEVDWRDLGGSNGRGRARALDLDDSGLFWFFDSENLELLVKVLDACSFNDHFWVFAAATTNVEYTLRVTDTKTGQVRNYFNPLGTRSPATTDTGAFGTCP
jgi:hypothetical protein